MLSIKALQASFQSELEKARKQAGEGLAMRKRAEDAEKEIQSLKLQNVQKDILLKKYKDHPEAGSSQEAERLKTELMQKETELSNLRADLSEATRRIQEATTNEEINARKRDEFYDMVGKKISMLSDYIKAIEGRLNS